MADNKSTTPEGTQALSAATDIEGIAAPKANTSSSAANDNLAMTPPESPPVQQNSSAAVEVGSGQDHATVIAGANVAPESNDDTVDELEDEDDENDAEDATPSSGSKRKGGDGMPKEKKERKKRTGYVNQSTPTLITNPGERTKIANERGKCLVRAAEILARRTNARVYLKCQYQSVTNKIKNFCYGEDFTMLPDGEGYAPPNLGSASTGPTMGESASSENLREIVQEGVAAALAKQPVGTEALSQETTGTSTVDLSGIFNSPSMGERRQLISRRRAASGNACQRCSRSDEFVLGPSGLRIPADWFTCTYPGCRARLHNECAGFPGVRYLDVQVVAPWYCLLHVGAGRPPISPEENVADVAGLQGAVGTAEGDPAGAGSGGFQLPGQGGTKGGGKRGARGGGRGGGRGARGATRGSKPKK